MVTVLDAEQLLLAVAALGCTYLTEVRRCHAVLLLSSCCAGAQTGRTATLALLAVPQKVKIQTPGVLLFLVLCYDSPVVFVTTTTSALDSRVLVSREPLYPPTCMKPRGPPDAIPPGVAEECP